MTRFLKAFLYAANGCKYAFSTQPNFRFHTLSAAVVIITGILAGLSLNEWLWLSAAIALVLISELFNTALEVLVNLISPGYHKQAGAVKDLAAGAVLISAIFALITGLLIFIPKFV